jgi:adenosylcobinamide kinase/adenosylcobinamide-phosphate guanylyltransferase
MQRLTLVLGGARSGKSRFALAQFAGLAGPFWFIATAEALDAEMSRRIERHRAERDALWRTLEAPLDVAAALAETQGPALIDCLSLWLSNLFGAGRDPEAATGRLLAALARHPHPVVLVSNEVGLGIVPDTPLGRAFRDAQGRLNQAAAAQADRVVLLVAGLPLSIKG